MLLKRVIPILLLDNSGLVKTIGFSQRRYIGDPINIAQIFSDKGVDELVIFDIDASRLSIEPSFDKLKIIAEQCFVPLGYGGGITSIDQARRIFGMGYEKVFIGNAAAKNLNLIEQLASQFGRQAVVGVVNVKSSFWGNKRVYNYVKGQFFSFSIVEYAKALVLAGAGEILLSVVDRDGKYLGLDSDLVSEISNAVNVPIIISGGCSSVENVNQGLRAGAAAVAAGSLFIYAGRHKAVLVNYPHDSILNRSEIAKLK